MTNALLIRPQAIAAASAYATTAGDPLNVGNDYAGVTWQATGASMGGSGPYYHYIDLDLGAAMVVDMAMIFGLPGGLPADATTDVQGVSALGGAQSSTTGRRALYAGSNRLAAGRGVSLWAPIPAAPLPASRYYRLSFSSAARFDISVARIAIGARIALARNFVFGGAFGARDLGSLDFSRRGVLLRSRGSKLRTAAVSFSNAYRSEVESAILPMLETGGNTETVGLVTDPTADPMRERRCYFGTFVGDLSTVNRNAVGWEWKTNLVSLF